jgi:hypothetical protein
MVCGGWRGFQRAVAFQVVGDAGGVEAVIADLGFNPRRARDAGSCGRRPVAPCDANAPVEVVLNSGPSLSPAMGHGNVSVSRRAGA